jgi:hypothetical protein
MSNPKPGRLIKAKALDSHFLVAEAYLWHSRECIRTIWAHGPYTFLEASDRSRILHAAMAAF